MNDLFGAYTSSQPWDILVSARRKGYPVHTYSLPGVKWHPVLKDNMSVQDNINRAYPVG